MSHAVPFFSGPLWDLTPIFRDLRLHLHLQDNLLGTGPQAPMLPLHARQKVRVDFFKICCGFHERSEANIERRREHRERFDKE